MSQSITKLDAARRQLVTAIRLHFDGGDSISVLSLAANAWEVIDVLCVRAGVASMSVQAREHLAANMDLKRDYINSPFRNFFKHADRDPDATLEIPPEGTVDGVLFLAVEDYIRLNQRSPVELQVFQLWYLACYPQKVAEAHYDEILEATASIFPGLIGASRSGQLALGVKALNEARAAPGVTRDERTEPHW